MSGTGETDLPSGVLTSSDGLALLLSVDDAFLQVLGTRFGGGVQACEAEATGLSATHVLRPASAGDPMSLLLAYSVRRAGPQGETATRIPGLLIGSITLGQGETPDLSVQAEIYDVIDPNAHADGEPLGGGLRLQPSPGPNSGSIDIVRTREQIAASDAGGAAQARGQIPPLGRHGQRAALGLGGGSHRLALMATTRTAVAGRLLGRLGALMATAGTIGPRLSGVTIGLCRS